MIEPLVWTEAQLESGRVKAIEIFRQQRMAEPLEDYLEAFDEYQGFVEDLLESTIDLTSLDDQGVEIVTDQNLLVAFRYLSGPPISADDLKTLADAVLSPGRLRDNPEMTSRIIRVVLTGLDRRRFPWISEDREPTEAERSAAVLASAALLATRKLETSRRTLEKNKQEDEVSVVLTEAKLEEVPRRSMPTISDAPDPGQYCRESLLGTRKADFVVGLYDRRVMPIECKVSNSATNSVKRLNNDAAVKATSWKSDFGQRQVVPTAVLSGVYKLHNLLDAQERGLAIFWAHDLPRLIEWIHKTRS